MRISQKRHWRIGRDWILQEQLDALAARQMRNRFERILDDVAKIKGDHLGSDGARIELAPVEDSCHDALSVRQEVVSLNVPWTALRAYRSSALWLITCRFSR